MQNIRITTPIPLRKHEKGTKSPPQIKAYSIPVQ